MSIGYSASIVALNKEADKTRLGVALGRSCISLGIPVTEIASKIGVSRQTVYNWFVGAHDPHESYAKEIERLISVFKRK